MDAESTRFLFTQLREDMQLLRTDVHDILKSHELEINELKRSRDIATGKIAATTFILMLAFEIGLRLLESALQK